MNDADVVPPGAAAHRGRYRPPPPSYPQQPPLPDLVQSSLGRKPPVAPPRQRRTRREDLQRKADQRRAADVTDGRQDAEEAALRSGSHSIEQQIGGPSWLNVGIELRQIAEEFRSTQVSEQS